MFCGFPVTSTSCLHGGLASSLLAALPWTTIYFREDMGIEEPADGVNFHCGKRFGKQRQVDLSDFQDSQGYVEIPYLKRKEKKEKKKLKMCSEYCLHTLHYFSPWVFITTRIGWFDIHKCRTEGLCRSEFQSNK
ncbi:hypothetical protein STEG23_030969, partial [Scotinomys teguina]